MIKVSNLRYKYPFQKMDTIKGINFNINQGEIFGFLGPSGSGKSTTQKILTGLLKSYSGSVEINDFEIKRCKSTYYEDIGVAFEFPNFYLKLTALENLKLFGSLYRRKLLDIDQILERVGLGEHKKKRVEQYSKGMKMRLNFCRAILHDPMILFLDEPTSGLDPTTARIIKDIIIEKKIEGKIVFLTTHDMNVADELCDRVAFLFNGTIPLCDTPKNLKLNYGKKTIKIEYAINSDVKIEQFDIEGLADNKSFLKILRDNEVRTIHSQEATLENIFIATTGGTLL